MGNALILNYHEILPDSAPRSAESKYAVRKQDFIKQLTLINQKGIPIVSMSTWLSGHVEADFAVVLTFDGGFASDYDLVKPILEEKKIPASFFPVLGFVDQENRLTWDKLVALSDAGFDIGSHGVSYKNMRRLRKEPCKLELELSKRLLEQKTGKKILSFAAPFGAYNRRMLKLAFYAGYKNIFTTRVKINTIPNDFILHRWNLKFSTSLESVDKMLTRGSITYHKFKILSRMKSTFSLSFGIGLIQKANLQLLKMSNK